jgi:hypothetical protein
VVWRWVAKQEVDPLVGYYVDERKEGKPRELFALSIILIVSVVDFIGSTVALLSGPSASTLRLFSIFSGELILERRLHTPTKGLLHEPPYLGSDVAFTTFTRRSSEEGKEEAKEAEQGLVVLTQGHTARMFDTKGREVWRWGSVDTGYVSSRISSRHTPPFPAPACVFLHFH